MPNIRWLLRLITVVHRFVYERTGGRLGANLGGNPMLLLYTVGRKSGVERVTPLLYIPDGDRWLLVASNAGDDRPPAWYLNLEAKPEVRIRVGRELHDVRARTAPAEERAELWPRILDAWADYAVYETRTDRPIPVVVLERQTV